ncbi:MAG: RNA polymerase factor sigma-54 [Sphaerochaetaceae bacterium]|nr:RNA polymerase factor sigma-54 [Sphaerochaetaceae bacterium]MDC7237499.1 RNA polymerase factor sigma-54 [Sphaerochaetaceae bacterium]
MGLSLELGTKQTLSLSPLMLQRLETLALPLTELQAKIQEAIESNPALDIPNSIEQSLDNMTNRLPSESKNDEYSDSSAYGSDYQGIYDSEASDRKQKFIENTLSSSKTLMQHLSETLHIDTLSEEEREIGELLISNLDTTGFNNLPPLSLIEGDNSNEILNKLSKEEKKALIIKMQERIQNYEPIGCCCDDYRQSLVVQAEIKGLDEELLEPFEKLVYNELQNIRSKKIKKVLSNLKIDEETYEYLFSFLQTLTPFPGSQFDNGIREYVIPDLSIYVIDGKIELETSSKNLPNLTISKEFTDLAKEIDDSQTKKYIKEQTTIAKELINQIEMRNKNLFKLGMILIEKQSDFFFKGPLYLKPLTQKEVALEMDVHETTISRLASSKWLDCDWGIIPIKNLFSNAVGDSSSNSKASIKERIKQIINENEGPKALSDQKISDKLAQEGIKIARRTVSKYRKELNIDSTFLRGN